MQCLLCQEKEANQTGSHIFTHSLISRCINEEGKKGRNKEMMFGFSQSGAKNLFVGNEILPESIIEINGIELSEKELENNKNELVVDNIYCSECEKLFGKIESQFSSKILPRIREKKENDFGHPNNILIRLYFYIQIWRASSYNYNDWNLSGITEEYLRRIIYEGCHNYEKGLNEDLEEKILNFPLVINYMDTPSDRTSTNHIFIPKETSPFLFFLCDFVVEFFSKAGIKPTTSQISNYKGLNEGLLEEEINLNEDKFKIRYISDDKRQKIIKSFLLNDFVLSEIERIKIRFVSEYASKKKRLPNLVTFGKFMSAFTQRNEVNTAMYQELSEDRISEIIKRIIETD